ncbi:unnamed protein product [Rhodiola kirilowii]
MIRSPYSPLKLLQRWSDPRVNFFSSVSSLLMRIPKK